jgi:hypothetical protein
MSEQLAPLCGRLGATDAGARRGHRRRAVAPVETQPRRSWRELRVGLQLASRAAAPRTRSSAQPRDRGIRRERVRRLAAEAPNAAAGARARPRRVLRRADIEVAVNVSASTAPRSRARVKSLALEHGLSETGGRRPGATSPRRHGRVHGAAARRPAGKPAPTTRGSPSRSTCRTWRPGGASPTWCRVAEHSRAAGGQAVNDNEAPHRAGLASHPPLAREIVQDMEGARHPGRRALARRLFS